MAEVCIQCEWKQSNGRGKQWCQHQKLSAQMVWELCREETAHDLYNGQRYRSNVRIDVWNADIFEN